MSAPDAKKSKSEAAERKRADKERFVGLFPRLVAELLQDCRTLYPDYDPACVERFQRVLEYNTIGGKLNRGLSVLDTFRHLLGDREPSEQEVEDCMVIGWCIELLQAYFLVADDMMDDSLKRRDQDCWYRVKGVGMIAINDAFLIESCIYKLLKRHFKGKKFYIDILELFLETTYQTVLGQQLDLITAEDGVVDFSKFSIAKHTNIVKYKTAFYSFYLPVAAAMHMHGVDDESLYANALKILLEMGIFFQVQDDFLDCYGTFEQIGKVGTDIMDNKCGWLVVQALELGTPEQIKLLEDNYARKDKECEARVKALYVDLGLDAHYKKFEIDSHASLMKLIESTSGALPPAIFTDFANKIYFRSK